MFKVGDIVRIIKKAQSNSHLWFQEMNDVIGDEGEIVEIDEDFEYPFFVKHINGPKQLLNDCGNYVPGWWFPIESLAFVLRPKKTDVKVSVSCCPNCQGNLEEKYSEYVGGTIKKCKKCGWC